MYLLLLLLFADCVGHIIVVTVTQLLKQIIKRSGRRKEGEWIRSTTHIHHHIPRRNIRSLPIHNTLVINTNSTLTRLHNISQHNTAHDARERSLHTTLIDHPLTIDDDDYRDLHYHADVFIHIIPWGFCIASVPNTCMSAAKRSITMAIIELAFFISFLPPSWPPCWYNDTYH